MKDRLSNRITWRQMTVLQRKFQQWQMEIKTWKRVVDFFREENIQAKNRLSDILKDGVDRQLLANLEDFHNQYIKHDEMMGLLRNEIAELDSMLLPETIHDRIKRTTIERKLDNLRHNISNTEKSFCELQLDFNKYLAEKIT